VPRASARGTVFALRVKDSDLAPESGLPAEVTLDEGALAPADLAEHGHVGIGEDAGFVESKRVVGEHPTGEIPSR